MRRPAPFLLTFLLTAAFISTSAIAAQPGSPEGNDTVSANPQLAERLGKDDGFALSVLYSGDMHGSLETCG